MTNGNFLQIFECAAANKQVWNNNVQNLIPGILGRLTATNLGIRSAANGLCLDVANSNYANGSPIHMWTCFSNANNQRWQLDTAFGILRSTGNTRKCLNTRSGNQGG